jgi:F0F1-type ATP synthase epsilon subunit
MKLPFRSKLLKIGLGLGLMTALSGCFGEVVEIPTAHRGVISTGSGLQDEILPPSKLRLSSFCRVCDNIILGEVSDYGKVESMQLYMPKDKLNITVETRGTFATSDEPADLKMIFGRVSPVPVRDRVSKVPANAVYETYAQQIIRDRVRSVIAKYDIATLMANREQVGAELRDEVRKALEGRPVKVLNFGLADIQPPEVIIAAEIKRKAREIAISEAEANKQIRLKDAEANLEVAVMQQAVELKEAETQVLVEQKLKEGFSQAYVAQRGLRILEQLAGSSNKVIFLPTEALNNPAVMIGGIETALEKSDGKEVIVPEALTKELAQVSTQN